MEINRLFAHAASKALAIAAAVMMMSVAFTACSSDNDDNGGGTTPTEEYVDLGLSVKWAKCNLGASKSEAPGDYYAWGETVPKNVYGWSTYKWGATINPTKYNATDNKNILEAADDAATAKLGMPWRMPTKNEIKELVEKCKWTWTTQNGMNGYKVKGPNGNSIFLPAAGARNSSGLNGLGSYGLYWSNSLYFKIYYHTASFIGFEADEYYADKGHNRYQGFSIRPVHP